ncbi:MAG: SLC26A/SulP transporter family protein [Gammaproteobacteria bacterium]
MVKGFLPPRAGDVWGGLASMLVALPSSIAFGVLVFSAIDPQLAGQGALYGMLGAAALGVVAALAGGTRALISAPCAPAAAILAGLAAVLVIGGTDVDRIPVLFALTVLLAGLLQLLFALLRGGRFIKYIPYPVVSGYMTGVGLIIAVSQLPILLGQSEDWSPAALIVGGTTIAVMLWVPRVTRMVPAAILALAAGIAAYLICALFAPALWNVEGNPLLIGPLADPGPLTGIVRAQFDALASIRLADLQVVAYTALALAALLSIDTLKTCVILDAVTKQRHDSNRELFGQGLGNLAAFTVGGMPGAGTVGPTMVNVTSGGSTRWSGLLEGVFVVLAVLLLAPLIAWVPLAALAGILLVVAYRMLDLKSVRLLRHRETRFDFAVIAAVAIVAVTVGLIAASFAGIALAILLFIRDQINGSVLRRRATLVETSSKRYRLEPERELLAQHGHLGEICALQGNLFFGTTDQLFSELEPNLRARRWVLLDLRRVQSLDYTAANLFRQMHARLAAHGGAMLFCGMPTRASQGQDIHRYLSRVGLVGNGDSGIRVFETQEDGLEWIEDRILDLAGWEKPNEQDPLDLRDIELFSDFDDASIEQIRSCVREHSVDPGQYVFRRGDEGDDIYLIRSGTVRILLPLSGGASHHLANFSRGNFCGEMNFLDKGVRSADAVAQSHCELYVLSRKNFNEHVYENSVLGVRVFSRLARAVSLRLRQTDAELRAVEDR